MHEDSREASRRLISAHAETRLSVPAVVIQDNTTSYELVCFRGVHVQLESDLIRAQHRLTIDSSHHHIRFLAFGKERLPDEILENAICAYDFSSFEYDLAALVSKVLSAARKSDTEHHVELDHFTRAVPRLRLLKALQDLPKTLTEAGNMHESYIHSRLLLRAKQLASVLERGTAEFVEAETFARMLGLLGNEDEASELPTSAIETLLTSSSRVPLGFVYRVLFELRLSASTDGHLAVQSRKFH